MEDLSAFLCLGLKPDEVLEADIDLRMTEFFEFYEIFEDDEIREKVIRIARAAFGQGYCEAYRDPRPGSLCLDHGYSIPERETA
ncbi:MAG TPA: hypothetical protein VLA89_06510 [Gemmatimonadales bacterium]|nr:hypothetical protein [Gemmatimonadales bacterium]